jgi:protein-disulfide isomerase
MLLSGIGVYLFSRIHFGTLVRFPLQSRHKQWSPSGSICGGVNLRSHALRSILCAGLALVALAAPLAGQATPPAKFSAGKSLGSPQAPITLEIFGDFQCPNCRLFFTAITEKVIANYVMTGKVYLVHRDFPLPQHANAHQAARWANAAALAGKFQQVEEALYQQQDAWASSGKIEQVLAGALSAADMNRVRDIRSTQLAALDAAIEYDAAMARARGVDSTPTVFVTHNGKTDLLPPGGVSYDLLRQLLDHYLQE